MENNFINREREKRFLEEKLRENRANLIIIYGRRRVGKSYLLTNFFKGKKAIYYLATKEKEIKQIPEISKKIGLVLGDRTLKINPFRTWDQIFEYLYERAKKEKIIFIIDEFSYLLESNRAIPSIIQKYWDELLSKTKIFILLCGSLISTMEQLLEYKNPLYGRRTGQWKVTPFNFSDFKKFFKNLDTETLIKIWSFTNGIPFYIREFTDIKNKKELDTYILKTFFNKGHIFYDEGDILISEELGERSTYLSIVEAISNGKTKVSEIANSCGFEITSLNKYLRKLIRLKFIKREIPITEKPKSKRSLYKMDDNFLHFWFKFVYPNKSLVEENKLTDIKNFLKENLNYYFSEKFEELSKEIILRKFNLFKIQKIGRQWGFYRDKENNRKEVEIDLVGLNEEEKKILFVECKWKNLKEKEVRKILNELKEKSKFVNWNLDNRKEFSGLIGKKIENKNRLRKEGYLVFDLKDFP